jgi:hypothetical protein
MYNKPRAASVIALGEGKLWALERKVFIYLSIYLSFLNLFIYLSFLYLTLNLFNISI